MSRQNKVAVLLACFVVCLTVFARYVDYRVLGAYTIVANVACDPTLDSCFMPECSSENPEDCDRFTYMKVETLARSAPACLQEHSCEDFSCGIDDRCSITYCSDESLEEGEICTDMSGNSAP